MRFNTIKILFSVLPLWLAISMSAQSIDRQVINSNGGTSTAIPNVVLDYNVGECVVVTGSTANNKYTQGFLQPDTVMQSAGIFSIGVFSSNESCFNSKDGYINLNAFNAQGTVTYTWSNGDSVSILTSLAPGTYIFNATDTAGNTVTDSIIIVASNAPCDVNFFNGLTPNNDGKNDVFYIDNITFYPQNNVFIYNRYGTKVWEGSGYDNVNVVFEGKDQNGVELPAATYFFVFTTDNKEKKGWIELIR